MNPDEKLVEGDDGIIYFRSSKEINADLPFKDDEPSENSSPGKESLDGEGNLSPTTKALQDETGFNPTDGLLNKRKSDEPFYDEEKFVQLTKKSDFDDDKWTKLQSMMQMPNLDDPTENNIGRKKQVVLNHNHAKAKKRTKYPNVEEEYVTEIETHLINFKEKIMKPV